MSQEFDFIHWIRNQQRPSDSIQLGIGDDLAALKWQSSDLLLAGVDQVLDGVHFDSAVHSPRAIGRKAMNRNLSDCAAMACLPAAALVTVALPKGVGAEYAQELYLGIKQAGEIFDCPVIGGDTGSWAGKLVVTVTILGRTAGISPITRSGARAGDFIYVTGPLGGSILGRQMTFEPRVALARELASRYKIHAMIDLSDGLSRDLNHICEQSGAGALLDDAAIPVHPDVMEFKDQQKLSPLAHAIHDGEDYELLLTSPDAIAGLVCIGVTTPEPGIRLKSSGAALASLGWEHAF
jgi:thiamine-monophosphate kinase